jgi:hypothetical protein
MKDFCELLKEHLPELFPKLVIAKTVNKGFHVVFRVPGESIEGNKKLASRPATAEEATTGDKVKVLFETRAKAAILSLRRPKATDWCKAVSMKFR